MKRTYRLLIGLSVLTVLGNSRGMADDANVGYAVNAQSVDATGSTQVIWGPIASRSTLVANGSTYLNFPQKFSGTTMTVGGVTHCAPPPPTQGPGTIVQ